MDSRTVRRQAACAQVAVVSRESELGLIGSTDITRFSGQTNAVQDTFTGMLRETLLAFAALAVFAGATEVMQCENEPPLRDGVQITVSGCDKPTCLLKQGTTIVIQAKFTPDKVIKSLVNDVSALLFNVPLPFVGVDGTNACENIYNADGSKAGCPLQPGVEYTYRNSFDVLPLYPRVALVVRYALREGNDKIICFEIPSKITK